MPLAKDSQVHAALMFMCIKTSLGSGSWAIVLLLIVKTAFICPLVFVEFLLESIGFSFLLIRSRDASLMKFLKSLLNDRSFGYKILI